MKDLTLHELDRVIKDHINWENGYQERFEDKLDAILLQTTKTNGRVNGIESWKLEAESLLEDYKENRAQVRGASRLGALVWGGAVVIIGLTFTLYVKTLKADIIQEIQTCCVNKIN